MVSESGVFKVEVFNGIGCSEFDINFSREKRDQLTPDFTGVEDLCDQDMIVLTCVEHMQNINGQILIINIEYNFHM
ncbi:MAG: hypothetical protein R2771_15835 [Saprospiraceae bacterium]